jgi:hypothetical protein
LDRVAPIGSKKRMGDDTPDLFFKEIPEEVDWGL